MQSTNNDCVASRNYTINQTTAQTHMLPCGRVGCPVVFVYGVGTDWLTVSCLITVASSTDHSPVCKGGKHSRRWVPAQLAPKSIASGRKRRKRRMKENKSSRTTSTPRMYKPTSVTCRGCHKVIIIDQRSRYYPGLWVKHRGKCPGIREIEVS
ncbi:uncharacterized protein EDB93DRAFT_1134406 [Suillus bovinus]|uniref:uncharacterized protein n=1 Tax=Suillus bovinus TaxID=48563 RepID=UPI001B879176|nr:uncharacterized protein EDB93DRAFT_1134406 [Suillus bovinus]KAG2153732.1 hypothetical protein EDB93DRAFT_1134406 [Suillus bovinus]